MTAKLPHITVTAGEPAGIGPDLCALLAQRPMACRLTVLGDINVIKARAEALKLPLKIVSPGSTASAGELPVEHHPANQAVTAGVLNTANAAHVLSLLQRATDGCLQGEFDAMVTAPVNKSVINDAGIPFSGHTEYLAERSDAPLPVMLLAAPGLRVALVTTHLPLSAVSAEITPLRLRQTVQILHQDLQQKFGLLQPRILVCGLNPHAGEGGHLGREEIDVIEPVLADMRKEGMDLRGPLPADTLFTPRYLADADAVLAMYHDQGLPVLKHAGFGQAVNITLGLPLIRTSVDHGTALELAGKGGVDDGSMRAAVDMAIELAATHQRSSLPDMV